MAREEVMLDHSTELVVDVLNVLTSSKDNKLRFQPMNRVRSISPVKDGVLKLVLVVTEVVADLDVAISKVPEEQVVVAVVVVAVVVVRPVATLKKVHKILLHQPILSKLQTDQSID